MMPLFVPTGLPLLTRAAYARELRTWALLALALGTIEGGVIGVVMKSAFAPVAPPHLINFAIAIVAGAPHYGNLFSVLWASLSNGRDKVRFIVAMQGVSMLCLGAVAVCPLNVLGLAAMTLAAAVARIAWAGVTTVRSVVWRVNYPRDVRARLAGGQMTISAVMMGVAGLVVGPLVVWSPSMFRWSYLAAAACGLIGAAHFRRIRVQGSRSLLASERVGRGNPGARNTISILRRDPAYRSYLGCLSLSGFANLMVVAPLIIVMNDRLGIAAFQQMLIVTSVPMFVVALTIPVWSRIMDRHHSVHFHFLHSCVFACTLLVFLVAVTAGWPVLLWLGALLLGISYAGGSIGWNLGHHDFAPVAAATRYMGVHATLTGIRGVLAPLAGVALYELLEAWSPGTGPWTLLAPALLAVASALGFLAMRRTGLYSPETIFRAE